MKPMIMCRDNDSGFEVKVVTPENYITSDSGLIYRDFEVGKGDCPKAGQQVFLSLSLKAIVSFLEIYHGDLNDLAKVNLEHQENEC